jgi:hypothetical protein
MKTHQKGQKVKNYRPPTVSIRPSPTKTLQSVVISCPENSMDTLTNVSPCESCAQARQTMPARLSKTFNFLSALFPFFTVIVSIPLIPANVLFVVPQPSSFSPLTNLIEPNVAASASRFSISSSKITVRPTRRAFSGYTSRKETPPCHRGG